jgi:predicted DNA-binding transcriptional regulator YafY
MDFETIAEEARNERTVIIGYTKLDGNSVSHEVAAYSVRGDSLYAYRVDVGEIRAFKIDRIFSVEKTGNSFTPMWNIEL